MEGASCTGTIIKTDPVNHIGWVLTAAHCVVEYPPITVCQGNDCSDADVKYQVIDYAPDPAYGGLPSYGHDLAVVRIAGVGATTPVIPIASNPDGIEDTGTPILVIGYGETAAPIPGEPAVGSWIRRKIALVATPMPEHPEEIWYDQSTGGLCYGDSGGPDLLTTGDFEEVVGVHSMMDSECDGGDGFSSRVSYGLDFITGELTKPLPVRDCASCQAWSTSGGECALLELKCVSKNPDCLNYGNCLLRGGTDAACAQEYPKGVGPYKSVDACPCNRPCADVCATDASCKGVPRCGLTLPADDCSTCMEASCCQEALDCTNDGSCYECVGSNDADASCASNAARKALATCAVNKCTVQCQDSELGDGGVRLDTPDSGATDSGTPGSGATDNGIDGTTDSTVTGSGGSGCSAGAVPPSAASHGALVAVGAMIVTIARRRRRNRHASP